MSNSQCSFYREVENRRRFVDPRHYGHYGPQPVDWSVEVVAERCCGSNGPPCEARVVLAPWRLGAVYELLLVAIHRYELYAPRAELYFSAHVDARTV